MNGNALDDLCRVCQLKRVTREGLTRLGPSLIRVRLCLITADIVARGNSCRADLSLLPKRLWLVLRYAPEVLCVERTLSRAEMILVEE